MEYADLIPEFLENKYNKFRKAWTKTMAYFSNVLKKI
jgi:hypothetical protein